MIYANNLQEFIAAIMLPFALVAGGLLLATLILLVLVATMVNLFVD